MLDLRHDLYEKLIGEQAARLVQTERDVALDLLHDIYEKLIGELEALLTAESNLAIACRSLQICVRFCVRFESIGCLFKGPTVFTDVIEKRKRSRAY